MGSGEAAGEGRCRRDGAFRDVINDEGATHHLDRAEGDDGKANAPAERSSQQRQRGRRGADKAATTPEGP